MKFDPYQEWLGIPPHRRPPTHYDLLGLSEGETDTERIRDAASQRYDHVKKYTLTGPLSVHANRILEELSRALKCLTDPERSAAYRREQRLAPSHETATPETPPLVALPVEAATSKEPAVAGSAGEQQKASRGPLLGLAVAAAVMVAGV
ncbi:MAG: hypothetical protein HQ582_24135, partial [Planctomycetes bacterium]|nr:hypothetical protein [Planctomycetota bacterium]